MAEVGALVAAGAVPGGQLGHRVVHVGVGACRAASSSVGVDLNIVYIQGEPKKRTFSKNENRPWWGFFLKKKSMTNKKKVSIGYIETFLFYWSWIFFSKNS